MGDRRTIKFNYYRAHIQEKDGRSWSESKLFDFEKWIEIVMALGVENSTKTVENVKVRLENCRASHKNEGFWGIRIMKLRDTNIPSIVKETKAARAVELADDEYIGEDLNILYDAKDFLFMIQSNKYALGTKKLEKYINAVYGDKNFKISLRPICDEVDLKKFKKKSYKSLEVTFSNEVQMNGGKSSLSSIIKGTRPFGCIKGSISLGLGRSDIETLSKEEIENALSDIADNQDVITGAKIKIQDDDMHTIDIIDLFTCICHNFIGFVLEKRTTLGFEYAMDKMEAKYIENRGRILIILSPNKGI